MLGKGEIINGFQTGGLIRMNDGMKLIVFAGDYPNNEFNFQKDLQKQVKLLEKINLHLRCVGTVSQLVHHSVIKKGREYGIKV